MEFLKTYTNYSMTVIVQHVYLHLKIMPSSASPPQPFNLSSRQINVRLGIFRISFDVFPVDKSSNDFSHLEAMEVDRVIYHLINNNKLFELNWIELNWIELNWISHLLGRAFEGGDLLHNLTSQVGMSAECARLHHSHHGRLHHVFASLWSQTGEFWCKESVMSEFLYIIR